MATIRGLCWTVSQDLFSEVDLDALFVRQLRVMGQESNSVYPYLLLIHTGKIAIGINPGGEGGPLSARFRSGGQAKQTGDALLVTRRATRENHE